MEAQAKAANVRISPRKVRLTLNLIRNKQVGQAIAILKNSQRNSSPVVAKLLQSAISNASNQDPNTDVDSLYVSRATADEAMTIKRFRPRAMGRASRINKRGSHITISVKS
jgi:large subunit ribosomal protein L22